MNHSLFPKHPETPRTVRVRIVHSTPSHTTVETLDIPSERWNLLASRLPATWAVGTVVTMTFTRMELEYLQGGRELET